MKTKADDLGNVVSIRVAPAELKRLRTFCAIHGFKMSTFVTAGALERLAKYEAALENVNAGVK